MRLFTFISAGAFVLLSAFVIRKSTGDDPPLFGVRWSLKKIHSDSTVIPVSTRAYIRFDKEKKSAGGNGSCNVFGGSVEVKDHEIKITDIFSTKMYCDAVQSTEDVFFMQLKKVDRYDIKGKSLLLYKDKKLLLEFEEMKLK